LKIELIEFVKRIIKFDTKLQIYNNGEDNAYPERMDRLINNSPTAKMSDRLMRSYVLGKGFEGFNDFMVNKSKQLTLFDFADDLTKSFVRFRGVFIHVKYNLNLDIDALSVIPFNNCRIGKKDDDDYSGKILVYDNWSGENGKIDKNKVKAIDVYNPNKNVIKAQINNSNGADDIEKIQNYKGQILFINLDRDYIYPLSIIDAVANDCDSEAQSSVFTNTMLRRGFNGTEIFVVPNQIENIPDNATDELRARYQEELNNASKLKQTLEASIGASNASPAFVIEADEIHSDNLDNVFKHIKIEGNIDDKMFEYTDKRTHQNITMAFNNIPSALLRSNDASLFDNSGAKLQEAKMQYMESTEMERNKVESIIKKLMRLFVDFNADISLKPLITRDVTSQQAGL
jgi:hypothetical protein